MKRTLTIIIALVLSLSLCACCLSHEYEKGLCVKCGAADPNYDEQAAAYDELMSQIRDYDKYKNIYASEEIGFINGGKAVQFLHQRLTEMKDYRDCADYLARFTAVKDKLLYIQLEETDNNGKLVNRTTIDYEYDILGRVKSTEHNEFMQSLGFGTMSYEIGETQYYITITYSKDNRIESLTYNYISTLAIVTPEYDENGRIISMFHQHMDAQYTDEFIYDEAGRLINVLYDDGYELIFEYNPDGTLSSSNISGNKTVYTYDENGHLTGWTRGNSVCTVVTDDQGNILQERIVAEDSVTVMEYVYGDYYVYSK